MDIRPLAPSAPALVSATRPATAGSSPSLAPSVLLPQDTLHLQAASPRAGSVAQSVFDHQDLNKGEHSYEVRGFGFSPGGMSLVMYQDPRDPAGNYVSARSLDGQLLWERQVSDEKVVSMTVRADGTTLARTDKRLTAVDAEGREAFEYEYPAGSSPGEPLVLPDGTAWWLDKRQGKLCGVRADGTPATPVQGFESVMDKCDEVVLAGKGESRLLARCGNDVWRVDPGTGSSEKLLSFKPPALPSDPSWRNLVDGNNYSARITDVRPTPDGGLATTMVESILVYGTPHCSPKFFDEFSDMPKTTLTQKRLLLLAPDGSSFSTPEMGNAAISLESSKSVLMGRNLGSDSTVERVTPGGTQELARVSHIAYSVLPPPHGRHSPGAPCRNPGRTGHGWEARPQRVAGSGHGHVPRGGSRSRRPGDPGQRAQGQPGGHGERQDQLPHGSQRRCVHATGRRGHHGPG